MPDAPIPCNYCGRATTTTTTTTTSKKQASPFLLFPHSPSPLESTSLASLRFPYPLLLPACLPHLTPPIQLSGLATLIILPFLVRAFPCRREYCASLRTAKRPPPSLFPPRSLACLSQSLSQATYNNALAHVTRPLALTFDLTWTRARPIDRPAGSTSLAIHPATCTSNLRILTSATPVALVVPLPLVVPVVSAMLSKGCAEASARPVLL
jgi:hypothetical protein